MLGYPANPSPQGYPAALQPKSLPALLLPGDKFLSPRHCRRRFSARAVDARKACRLPPLLYIVPSAVYSASLPPACRTFGFLLWLLWIRQGRDLCAPEEDKIPPLPAPAVFLSGANAQNHPSGYLHPLPPAGFHKMPPRAGSPTHIQWTTGPFHRR